MLKNHLFLLVFCLLGVPGWHQKESILINFESFCPILVNSVQLWSILSKFGQFCPILVNFGPSKGPLGAPEGTQEGPKGPKRAPRGAQEESKRGQEDQKWGRQKCWKTIGFYWFFASWACQDDTKRRQFWSILIHFVSFWLILHNFDQFCPSLVNFVQFWTCQMVPRHRGSAKTERGQGVPFIKLSRD